MLLLLILPHLFSGGILDAYFSLIHFSEILRPDYPNTGIITAHNIVDMFIKLWILLTSPSDQSDIALCFSEAWVCLNFSLQGCWGRFFVSQNLQLKHTTHFEISGGDGCSCCNAWFGLTRCRTRNFTQERRSFHIKTGCIYNHINLKIGLCVVSVWSGKSKWLHNT